MARKKLIHVHSNVYESGAPKAPTAANLELGEIAINYNNTEPAMFIKSSGGTIVKFNAVQRSEISQITSDISDIKTQNKIKLNGTEKTLTGTTWEFYAPTASGATGSVLVSKGANTSPEWKAQSALTAGTASNALKTTGALTISGNGTTLVTFNGSANTGVNITYSSVGAAPTSHDHSAGDLPTATTSAYGITKLGTTSGTAAEGNHTHSQYENPAVTNKSATWAWGSTVTAATIGSTAITIAAPAKPTPSDIGAAASSHTHAGEDVSAATSNARGTVKPGTFLTVDSAGTMTVSTGTSSSTIARGDHTHSLPTASTSTYGIVKVGSFIGVSNGVISVSTGTTNATVARGDHNHAGVYANASHDHTAADLPTATTTEYGIIKLGTASDEAAIGNHTHSQYENPTVTNKDVTLAWGTKTTAATIGNTAITLTPMAKPSASDIGAAAASHTHGGGDITSAVANATNATNADKVDGYHVSVVTSMPASPDASTIYILK